MTTDLGLEGFEKKLHEHHVVLGSFPGHPPHLEGPGGALLRHKGEGDVRLHRLPDAGLRTRLQHPLSLLWRQARAVLVSEYNYKS